MATQIVIPAQAGTQACLVCGPGLNPCLREG
jgi:hypothetical protein